jgi:hypothetical protein
MLKDYVFGAKQLGLLKGQKIGVLEQTCYPELNTAIASDLSAVGLSIASSYNYGCDTSPVNAALPTLPTQDLAAVLQFKAAGVTTVLYTARDTVIDFANMAQGQGYVPRYVIPNDQSMALIADSSSSIPASFNGAVAITTDQEGASNTPGYQAIPATVACAELARTAGVAPPDDQHRLAGELDGDACASVSVLVSAINHLPALSAKALPEGLVRAGPMQLSYPAGPMDATNPQNPTGGQFWRPANWNSGCSCWKVTTFNWTPGWN